MKDYLDSNFINDVKLNINNNIKEFLKLKIFELGRRFKCSKM